jgi:hypothetical protein
MRACWNEGTKTERVREGKRSEDEAPNLALIVQSPQRTLSKRSWIGALTGNEGRGGWVPRLHPSQAQTLAPINLAAPNKANDLHSRPSRSWGCSACERQAAPEQCLVERGRVTCAAINITTTDDTSPMAREGLSTDHFQ